MNYGFIYIWYDKKYKRYYVGRHWGTEDDGYICSSNRMGDAYRRRPKDFRRKIISKIYTSKEDLVIEEQKWLDMIKPEECGQRYYNVSLKSDTPTMRGRKHSAETIEKIRNGNIGKQRSLETKEKIRLATRTPCTEQRRNSLRKIKRSEEFKQKVSVGLKIAYETGKR